MYDRYSSQKELINISIIIPVKIGHGNNLDDFLRYIVEFATETKDNNCQIIIADESENSVYQYISKQINNSDIIHFEPATEYRTGSNDKLNGVYTALKHAKFDKVLLVDDHYRVSKKTLISLLKYYDKYDCFKMMPKYDNYCFSVLVDLCGMLVINILDKKKQYCGHNAFRKSHIDNVGFPNRNTLYDELVIERKLKEGGYTTGYIKGVSLEATQNITVRKFLEQRVRYAYENIGLPLRFTFFVSVIPVLVLCILINSKIFLLLFALLTFGVLIISLTGQVVYGKSIIPKYTFLLSPIWFWFYPFTSWIAIYKYLTGGVVFGGNKIKKSL